MRTQMTRLAWLSFIVLFIAGCQRTPIYLSTPANSGLGATPTPERSALVAEVDGTVQSRASTSADWGVARQGQVLNEGSQLRTGPGGHAVIHLTEGSRIYVDPDTLFTFNQLNPYLDSLLTALSLEQGRLWILLNDGALDVQTPFGVAAARAAYLSIEYQPQGRSVTIMCLEGVCGFGSVLIPSSYKLVDAEDNTSPEPMTFGDFGNWGNRVPEATQLAYLATEAIAQGSATVPVVATPTATDTEPATETPEPSPTPVPDTPTATDTAVPDQPTSTPVPPTDTPLPTVTPFPSPTQPPLLPTVTPRPVTPIPAAPIIGRHTVRGGETLFCLARGYGVLPAAIAQANGLRTPFTVFAGQVLSIPQVQWHNISAGPVCATQFASPFPGLPVATATSRATSTAPAAPLTLHLDYYCIANCGSSEGSYVVHFEATASGGQAPYSFNPGQSFDLTIPHCTDGQGTVTVTSADGQTASASWFYDDVACPNN